MLTHPKQPKKTTTSGPEPGFSGPRTWVWARCGHFGGCFVRPDVVMFVLILLGEVHTKSDHIWPNPIVVGPDVFILKCSNWISRRHHEHRGVFLGLDRPHVPSAWRRRASSDLRFSPGPPGPSIGPHPETAPKFTRAPTANPHGTEGFLRHFWGPQEPPKCAS